MCDTDETKDIRCIATDLSVAGTTAVSASTEFIFTRAGATAGALELSTQLPLLLINALQHINAAHY
jgi:hypothetical protein